MSIKIPGNGPGGVAPPGAADVGGVADKRPTDGTFADKLGRADAPGTPGTPDALATIAAELRAGQLTPQQAVDKLLELTVQQGAAAHLPERVKDKLRADLAALLTGDPRLADKAQRIGLVGAGKPGGESDDR